MVQSSKLWTAKSSEDVGRNELLSSVRSPSFHMETAIYVRLGQGEDGPSLAMQLGWCRKYARDKELAVVTELADLDSGLDPNRPMLTLLREVVARGGNSVVVVAYPHCLSRRTACLLNLLQEFDHCGVQVSFARPKVAAVTDEKPWGRNRGRVSKNPTSASP